MVIHQIDKERFVTQAKKIGIARAAAEFGISTRTGTRIVQAVREQGGDAALRRGRPSLPATEEERIARQLMRAPFPYPVALDSDQIRAEFESLVRHSSTLDEQNTVRPRSNVGVRACYSFFPNRYAASSGGLISAEEAWRNERALRRAVRLQITYGDPTTPERVLRAITLQCRTPTVFRPAAAKFIYNRYTKPGDLVWDPCSGYGGRLLGAAAAGVRYIGTDVDAATVDGNLRLAEAVGFSDGRVIMCPAEDFTPPTGTSFVFTSPPYFDRERYSRGRNQSWRRHGTSLDEWIEGFLQPVIVSSAKCLRAGENWC